MGIAAGLIGAAVLGAGASAYGALEGADAASDAQRQNREDAQRLNDLNYRMFRESRGADGSALLPLYFGSIEQQLANDARDAYYASRRDPALELAEYENVLRRLRPTIDAGTGAIEDIYSGALTQRRLDAAKPVQAARTAGARGQSDAVMSSLLERLNALKTDSARKGFVGGSTFDQNRLLASTVGARSQAADVMSRAEIENALQTFGIREDAENLKLSNINAPIQRAEQLMTLSSLPARAQARSQAARLEPFNWFRLNPQAFQLSPLPQVTPTLSPGQVAGAGLASVAGAAGNYFANSALTNQIGQMNQANMFAASGNAPGNFSTLTPAQQSEYMRLYNQSQFVPMQYE